MGATFEDSYGHGDCEVEITAELDRDIFISLVVTRQASGDDFVDLTLVDEREIEVFFDNIDRVRKDYLRLKSSR